jgi:hypothetical protein
MYAGVPITPPVITAFQASGDTATAARTALLLPMGRARPQSIRYTAPKSSTMMFSGLMSQWRTPRLWAKATASHTLRKADSISCMLSVRVPVATASLIQAARVRPRT